ncbi:MAG: hypothetical protein PHN93_09940 [Sphaerochaetaceae bacterium]|jgi:hypothetical protein|nr:hypothetical protein [Sphaerochaetaceae bacterium]MDX9940160.1 hypothetical protein [Sphaerochaetaceae bacterium]
MAQNPKKSLQVLASPKILQLLISLLFIAMGIIGFSSGRGTGGALSRELSNMFGGDRELLLYVLSTLELLCGIFLGAQLFVTGIPDKFVTIALTFIWIFWVALIVILDVLTIDFGRFDGSGWFAWIEQVVLHLIVLASIMQIQK